MVDPSGALAPSLSEAGLFVHVGAAVISTGAATNTVVLQQEVAVTRNATSFIYFDTSGKVVAVNTSAFPAGSIPIATAIAGSVYVNTLTDSRPDFISGGSGGGSPAGSVGDVQLKGVSGFAAAAGGAFNFDTSTDSLNVTGDGGSIHGLIAGSAGRTSVIVDGTVPQVQLAATESGGLINLTCDAEIDIGVTSNTSGIFIDSAGAASLEADHGVLQIQLGASNASNLQIGGGTNAADNATIIIQNGAKLAFFNGTPIVKPAVTGSKGANAALASLLTELAALGLITDSTT